MSRTHTLVVFARYPTPGTVKTRLAVRLGDEDAARLYEAFVRDLVERFAGAWFGVQWAIAPPDPGFADHFGLPCEACSEQRGDDLGARMRHVFETRLEERDTRCVLIGSDMPHLPVARVEEAFERLSSADVVLGPALDGGYYLIAMRRPHDVFSGITWSTGSVLEETEKRVRMLGLSLAHLETDFDVDEAEDVERLRRRLQDRNVRCRVTSRALAGLARR